MKIFYLHGMGGSPKDWMAVMELLPGEALGLPHGLSFDEASEKICTQLRQEKEPFVLCGYSMGGRLAIRVAGKLSRSSLAGLVLLSTGLGFSEEKIRQERKESDAKWAMLASENLSLFWKNWYEQEIFASFRELPEAKKKNWVEDRFSLSFEHLRSQFLRLGPGQHEFLLPELSFLQKAGISVLYLAGEKDKKYSKLAKQLEGLPVEILDGGHILPLEAPMLVANSLKRFLERVTKGK